MTIQDRRHVAHDTTYFLLLNLALRCRWARIAQRNAIRDRYPRTMIDHYEGAALEAWNSFQAAKTVVTDNSLQPVL